MAKPTQFRRPSKPKPVSVGIIQTPWEMIIPGNEDSHQKALFAWAHVASMVGFEKANDPANYRPGLIDPSALALIPDLDLLFAIPNGGARDGHTAAILKATGVKAGVWDMFLPVAKDPNNSAYAYHGLWIELKTPERRGSTNGGLQDNQVAWGEKMLAQGYACHVAYGFDEVRAILQWYLK